MDTADTVVTPFGMSPVPPEGEDGEPRIVQPPRRVRRGPVATGGIEEETSTTLISDRVHALRDLARRSAAKLDAVLEIHFAANHRSSLRVVGHDRRLAPIAWRALDDAYERLARIRPMSADAEAVLLHRLITAWLDAGRGGAALGSVAEGLRVASEYPLAPLHWLRHHSWLAAIHAGIGPDAVNLIVRSAAGIE